MREFETTCPGGFQVSRDEDVTGYPCFFVHGMSGHQKRDAERLNEITRLFAAAPLLLESLQSIVATIEHPRTMSEDEARSVMVKLLEKSRAAIAKATV